MSGDGLRWALFGAVLIVTLAVAGLWFWLTRESPRDELWAEARPRDAVAGNSEALSGEEPRVPEQTGTLAGRSDVVEVYEDAKQDLHSNPPLADDVQSELPTRSPRSGGLSAYATPSGGEVAGVAGRDTSTLDDYAALGSRMTYEGRASLVERARSADDGESGSSKRERRIAILADNIARQNDQIAELDGEIATLSQLKVGGKARLAKLTEERDALARDTDGLAMLLQEELDQSVPTQR